MPIVNRLKKIILGSSSNDGSKSGSGAGARSIPAIVKIETDVREYWTLDEVIGDGAFGNVYKARSKLDPGRVAAAKAMELEDDEGQDVMVEVSILTHCKHPNIVELYDAFTMGSRITLLLEYCGGGAVDSIMMELSRNLSEAQIHYIMKEILKALDFLHGKNVIHRDLKAGNVLLTSDAKVKLADFGVSALCKDAREVRSTFIGTPYWMAPEVMLCETFPEKHYNKLADIWSFGITLIEMAEEKPPYAEMNPAKVVFKVIKADPPTLERPQKWSTNFRSVVAKCLTKDPENRPTAADVLAHPFFVPTGSIQCIRSLISEMNAEQVTTEVVMGSDDDALFDDDDDDDTATVSSATTANETQPDDTNSGSSKQQRQSNVSVGEQKGSEEPVSVLPTATPAVVSSGTTTIVELAPTPEIGTTARSTMPLLPGMTERAPSLPQNEPGAETNTIAVVEINAGEGTGAPGVLESPGSSGSSRAARAGQRAAVEDALSDLDKALNLEEAMERDDGDEVLEEPSPLPMLAPSPGFLPSERSEPTVPLEPTALAAVTVKDTSEKRPGSRASSKSGPGSAANGEVQLLNENETTGALNWPAGPKVTHRIYDIVAEQRKQAQQGLPTTVHISDSGAVVTTNTLMDEKMAEVNAQADLERPTAKHDADFVCTLKVSDRQQLRVKIIGRKDDGDGTEVVTTDQKRSGSEQMDNRVQQQPVPTKMPKKIKDLAAYKSFDSLMQVGNDEFTAPAGTAQRCSSQPQVNIPSKGIIGEARSRHIIPVGTSDSSGSASAARKAPLPAEKRPLGVSLSTEHVHGHGSERAGNKIPHSASQDVVGGLIKSYDQSNQNYYYYCGKSVSEKNSPLLEPKQQPVRAEFKILAFPGPGRRMESEETPSDAVAVTGADNLGTKKTVVEVRRPSSYPETISMQKSGAVVTAATKSRGVSSPATKVSPVVGNRSSPPMSPGSFSRHSAVVAAQAIESSRRQEQNRNRVGQDRNWKRIVTDQEQEQDQDSLVRNRNGMEQKKDRIGNQNGALPVVHHHHHHHHQVSPTTSTKRREQQQQQELEYNYFGTASSSSSGSSKQLQRRSYESSFSSERDSSSFLAAVGGTSGAAVAPATMVPASLPATVAQIPRVTSAMPPPEPPVDYYENSVIGATDNRKPFNSVNSSQPTTTATKSMGNGTKAPSLGTSNVGARRSPHRQTVTKKTRVYVVDGVQMTSTSHQVFGVKQDYELRKQQLHELRRLQREEARQQRELNAKAEALRSDQAKRFAAEKETVYKNTEIELQALAKTQKRQLKECEELHNEDMKQALKRIQNEQERELRLFREQLKQEHRDLKIEMEAVPKAQRKDKYGMRKEQLEKEQQKREVDFITEQQSEQTALLTRIQLDHKMKILQIEKNFQQQKHAVLRSREASEWDLEEKQLIERHLLNKQELKDRFYLQRTQMMARHQRELDHMRKVNEMDEEEQVRLYANFKKRLPKDFRTESKTRIAMFKESLRISCQNDDPATLNEKMRAFEEKEKQRVRNALEEHDSKYSRKLRELREKNATAIRELEEIHNEKRRMLLEAEQSKMEMYEKEYEQVVADWKAGLPIRKQALEAEFAREIDEVEAFYRKENPQLQQLSVSSTPTGSIASKQGMVIGSAITGN